MRPLVVLAVLCAPSHREHAFTLCFAFAPTHKHMPTYVRARIRARARAHRAVLYARARLYTASTPLRCALRANAPFHRTLHMRAFIKLNLDTCTRAKTSPYASLGTVTWVRPVTGSVWQSQGGTGCDDSDSENIRVSVASLSKSSPSVMPLFQVQVPGIQYIQHHSLPVCGVRHLHDAVILRHPPLASIARVMAQASAVG